MLSIIIPTLNEEKYLPRLLQSIKRQNFFDYEIIVSDGGSTDKTVEIAKTFQTKLIVDGSVKHPSFQRNSGAKLAQGDTLLFLDADSVLPDNFLSIIYQQFKDRNLYIAGFFIKFNPNRWCYNIYSLTSNVICYLKQNSKHPAAIGAGLIADHKAHNSINGFDLTVVLAEDYDYCERMAKLGRFRMIKKVKLLYSSRRIEKEGFFQSGWKWLKMGLFTITNRKIRKQIVKYDFGKF